MKRSAAAATLLVALAACCFGSIAILVTIAQRAGAPLLTILVWRYLLGAASLVLLSGDVPLLRADTLASLVRRHEKRQAAATVLTAVVPSPGGYGRRVASGRDAR